MAFTLKILDHPDQRKIHHHPIPLLGSIAVYLGLLAGLFFTVSTHSFKVVAIHKGSVVFKYLKGTLLTRLNNFSL
jgi:UDP-N-acetylmuramyl pentapeptide phosphotransferase/UDP-N-acetylglucosamine-1-phosphate transferase